MRLRRYIAVLFLTLITAVAVYAAVVLDKHNLQDNSATGSTTIALTLTSTAAGSNIVCGWTWSSGSSNSFTNVTDNVNAGAYSTAVASHTNATIGQIEGMVYKENSAGGTITITAHATQSVGFGAMACASFTGLATSSSLDVAATAKDGTGTNPTCNAMTTTANGDLIFSFIIVDTAIPTAGSGYTVLDNMTFTFASNEYQIQSTAGSTTVPWVSASSQNYGCIAAAFKAAGGGGGGTLAGSQHGGNHFSGGPRKIY